MDTPAARPVFPVVLACLVALALTRVKAQRGVPVPAPARDNQAPATGTGLIAGTVVTDETSGRPLRRATVTIRNIELSSARTTISDDAGRFAFAGLPEGRFTL